MHTRRGRASALLFAVVLATSCATEPQAQRTPTVATSHAPAPQLIEHEQSLARWFTAAATANWYDVARWQQIGSWADGLEVNAAADAQRAADEQARRDARRAAAAAQNATSQRSEQSDSSEPPTLSVSVPAAIAAHFGTGSLGQSATRVAQCESGLTASIVSPGGGNWGLFQLNTAHVDSFRRVTGHPFYNGALDADLNAQFARWLYDSAGGWGPWSCRWAA